uniref:Uncharacterized protein n=1 Tax=Meloidogyne hapla TaxID=6305 RepID=A0A1I8BWP1_MELHA
MFILYPDNLKYTLNVLEDQFEVLFTITNIELPNYKKLVEAKIDQITFISQLHLLMSTMKKYNKKILNMGIYQITWRQNNSADIFDEHFDKLFGIARLFSLKIQFPKIFNQEIIELVEGKKLVKKEEKDNHGESSESKVIKNEIVKIEEKLSLTEEDDLKIKENINEEINENVKEIKTEERLNALQQEQAVTKPTKKDNIIQPTKMISNKINNQSKTLNNIRKANETKNLIENKKVKNEKKTKTTEIPSPIKESEVSSSEDSNKCLVDLEKKTKNLGKVMELCNSTKEVEENDDLMKNEECVVDSNHRLL